MSLNNRFFTLMLFAAVLFPTWANAQNFEQVYDHIGLVAWEDSGENVSLEVYPMGNPNEILFSYGAGSRVTVLADGSLKIVKGGKTFIERAPYAYQESPNGDKIEVPVSCFAVGDIVSLKVRAYEMAQVLNINLAITQPSFSFLRSDFSKIELMTTQTIASAQ